jgi:ferrous iron transport protein B
VNVVDACALERNLFFTLQLLELESPLVIALNQMDSAEKKGLRIDHRRLGELLRVPIVPMVAIRGVGFSDLLDKIIQVYENKKSRNTTSQEYGREIEQAVSRLEREIQGIDSEYPSRWLAIKLLEDDEEAKKIVYDADQSIQTLFKEVAREIERIHGESPNIVMASERYTTANRITTQSIAIVTPARIGFADRLDELLTDKVLGYPIMAIAILIIFYGVFTFGDVTSEFLIRLFDMAKQAFLGAVGPGLVFELFWEGLMEGVIAGITIALPYIVPFYIAMAVLEDSGYLARVAFLTDAAMHKIGLHGKAFIPIILCYGCNVPGCLACRILETDRDRILASFVATLIPCTATTVVIMGLVGTYVGLEWALGIYALNLIIVFVLGRAAFKVLPGEPLGLIMEMPPLRTPTLEVTVRKTWFRHRDFVYNAFPLIVLGNLVIKLLMMTNLLGSIEWLMSPITVGWLGLPSEVGITLIFGILRKELALVLLSSVLGTQNLSNALTPIQMIVFATVTMLYIPCIATIAVLAKEFGYRRAFAITLFEIFFAIAVGGVLARTLVFF